jgi:hypothetical protein
LFPHCNQPGYLCDIDHTTPWDEGGHTCPGNNRPGCRRHHNCKTHTRWSYRVNPDCSYTWTADTGHTYTSHPPERWTNPSSQPAGREEGARKAVQEALQDRCDREDRDYADLERWLVAEIQRERDADRTENAQAAQQALAEARAQRHDQLLQRDDELDQRIAATPGPLHESELRPDRLPDNPPF